MNDIFISYSRQDKRTVDAFASLLENLGYKVWIDRNGIESGDQFRQVLADAIRNSKALLFFSSEASNKSIWTTGEVAIAKKEGIKIIPIRLDDTPYNDSIRADLTLLDFVNYEPDHHLAKVKVVRSLMPVIGENEQASQFISDDAGNALEVSARAAAQSLGKRMYNSLLDNLFKYIFCAFAVFVLVILFALKSGKGPSDTQTGEAVQQSQMPAYLKVVNKTRTGEFMDNGIALLEAYEDGDYVVFPFMIYEGETEDYSFSMSYFDIEDDRAEIIKSIKDSRDQARREYLLFKQEGKGIRRKYIGSRTGVEYDVDITNEEIVNALNGN